MNSTQTQPGIAAIVPVYNEVNRVGNVLEVLTRVADVTEVIVVDDGSSDGSAECASHFCCRVLQHRENQGKAAALWTGLQATKCPIVLFVDADLTGLTVEHIRALLLPVVQGRADMTIGQCQGGRWRTNWAQKVAGWMSGQRALRTDIIDGMASWRDLGWGIEAALTREAKLRRRRILQVPLHGLSQVTKEEKLGYLRGSWQRMRMYGHILHFLCRRGNSQRPVNWFLVRRWSVRISLLLGLVWTLASGWLYIVNAAASRQDALPPLTLPNPNCTLIIAPHPDDDVIACGGLIAKLREQRHDVCVVILTNGDGFPFEVVRETKRPPWRCADYLELGRRRQKEGINALQQLGMPPTSVIFLGFPDRGLSALWIENWNTSTPCRSPYTQRSSVPYPMALHPGQPYSGEALLQDLNRVIREVKPSQVFAPHPDDSHPDHWAASAFTQAAMLTCGLDLSKLRTYLAHYGPWPTPRGFHPTKDLAPPSAISSGNTLWQVLPLSAAERSLKFAAVEEHQSQKALTGYHLYSFVRQTELFGILPEGVLPLQGKGTIIFRDPVRATNAEILVPGVDLKSLTASTNSRGIVLRLDLTQTPRSLLRYSLLIRSYGEPPDNPFSREFLFQWSGRRGVDSPEACHQEGDAFALTAFIPWRRLRDCNTLLALGIASNRNHHLDHVGACAVHLCPAHVQM